MRRLSAPGRSHRSLALILIGAICLQWMLGGLFPSSVAGFVPDRQEQGGSIFLPLVMANYVPPEGRLCRFGVGAPTNIADYPVNNLRIGWYTDWGSALKPARPGGIEYLQMVRLAQTGPTTYASSPSASALPAMIAANPGALWVIGNEPDRRAWQDSLEPQVYAIAYHDLYGQIKNADPSSRIVAGSIVQPTPLRLQYLDLVLSSYRARFGVDMPVDVWNIHAFILQEKSCSVSCPYDPDCGWGAGIPPGMSDCTGKTYTIEQHDDLAIFKQFIVDFRRWMADNNYQDRPLIITEFGVLMPPDYGTPPFGPPRVNAFMNATFDYLSTAVGPSGYGSDKGRLVQAWAWYSLSDNTSYNGWLFDPVTKARTALGNNFAAYTASVTPRINLTPVKLWTEPAAITGSGQAAGTALAAQVANNGNIAMATSTTVRFYSGDPNVGGVQIGTDQILWPLDGCANTGTARVTWTGATPGTVTVWAVVDPNNTLFESDEADNRLSAQITVGQ